MKEEKTYLQELLTAVASIISYGLLLGLVTIIFD